ncbi:Variable outer membrane protein [Borrelia duttonii CR2A]|uniref:Variable outer membrane protein n=1 Tax=Borrelia duttonii CR2A TaxID=1432657 RepID=W6TWW1_9SPIR|nr:Variable outer membrane protein [Borrelia duttonii CR2A]
MMRYDSGVGEREQFLGSIANLGKGFLDIFVSFGDIIIGTLGDKGGYKEGVR